MVAKTVLLDTIAFDLYVLRPDELSEIARTAIDEADKVLLSSIILYELSNHVRTGKVAIREPFDSFYRQAIRNLGITLMDLQWSALAYLSTFAYVTKEVPYTRTEKGKVIEGIRTDEHKDPWDRLIIAHALTLDVPVVSNDEWFPYYKPLGLKIIWK